MLSVLLVEDEISVGNLINKGLSERGYKISIAPDGDIGYEMATKNEFDIMILDIMLPGMNGLELCKRLRNNKIDTPILMLTALSSTENIVTGLDSGADDYITKPFKFAELEARIRSLARRKNPMQTEETNVLRVADLEMNPDSKTVTRNGKRISLTSTEFRLLEFLMKNKGKVLSRMTILENVWGIDFNISTNVVDVYINYVRKKIESSFDRKLLHTVVGMGYVIKDS
ncbi:response regulator transcription factor [Flavihumibacter cheonanensis]|jgi:DNA-binding response OmpR family regulator|uniref:response regulator transcription factor n=1 Tax=Flavihumibacter cheonanensis TaxID=1442385 RepID=UPI001EF8DF7F|nr:response regulator transcription factor [Flavihumibacter cheonanensis]MCG7750857.1 response regulator transcription factor [Flavihumibacter cheonanensis]MCU0386566.1 response regulator transcription factor [Flavihumibacter sp.]